MNDSCELDELILVMKALADPGRVLMLKLMEERALCVCELRHCLELAQPTVSRHLKVLEQAGLVERRRDGQWVEYSLAEQAPVFAATMLAELRGWLAGDVRLERMREMLQGVDRATVCAS
ncbi:ArsR/SmtB family transcription factor [Paucidesulfovibrio longus]|uniref:ArsR/SmtB family transcription factor n=1 Tax=Paucidesulfovibrio longus TaxID=889 RepID=UPI0003B5B76C|nr:metalloregulator ArsR/SmtB family transcription factor [Paucidesulfovibrio longus]